MLSLISSSIATLAVLAAANLANAAPDQEPRPVRVQTVVMSRDRTAVTYSGTVQPRVQVDLAFRVGGKVISRPINLADRVTGGQILATLDPTDRLLAVEAARNGAAAAEAEAINARDTFVRYTQLGQNSAAYVPTEYDRRKTAMLAANARLVEAQNQVSLARSQEGYDALKAEADGVIVSLPVELGQVVSAGQTVATLAYTNETDIVVDVPESRLEEVRVVDAITIALWASPGKVLTGKLRQIGALADPVSRTFAVKVSVVGGARELLGLGMTATVRFEGPPGVAHVILPASALAGPAAEPSVWVLNEQAGRAVPRKVEVVSLSTDGNVVIGGGLNAGEKVVTAGADLIDRDMPVRAWQGPAR